MSMVHAAPEAHLVLDPLTSLLAAEREDIIQYSMDPIMEQLDELDKIADDLINSLSPTKPLMNSYPGRENTSYSAGFYGNSFYGVVVGLAVAGLMLLVMSALGVM
ncbi:tetrahydromethanopterin S-methyltransferase subunit B [Methanolobus sediminis]|uniref:Tetrahydromethanopterin S-methyltransferase subunit B n=1 Tax=Methanolobus sediminis TaxID=3072978 RepID=A0AA51UII5_9EURY|nr:tetrahydromethanopterin S-methyltransferase subunit B [Methanolobus sediminis]WMW24203.1 tetrahydromethanopterin S-methyltransferase subunit B [Methanolobus sediminis]